LGIPSDIAYVETNSLLLRRYRQPQKGEHQVKFGKDQTSRSEDTACENTAERVAKEKDCIR
jgi:hypothetical protein